ncbi:vWA domain-containing protein [Kibdelosporangium aridum]|uniref:vWA domain-containing protein n=1 Tax=Kibdelosporangium aridum TaxID=2030 RepID=UPI0005262616
MGFQLHVDHNKYLPEGGRSIDAVVSVSASGGRRGPAITAAEVIMIDCSSSMEGEKIIEAKRATNQAIDLLRDEVAFAVVAGTTEARMVYPANQALMAASPATRADAREAVRRLVARGGTAIGTWLDLANELFRGEQADIKHAILLTDGHNVGQKHEELLATLERCRGNFVCESRGVGDGWSAEPLNAVADVLLGTADGLPDAKGLAADFQQMIESVMGKTTAGVSLRLWLPRGARIRFVKQVFPDILPLTENGTTVSERITDYPTGAWGAETRDYHLSIELPPGKQLDEEMLAGLVKVVAEGQEVAEGLIVACWTADATLSTKMNQRVAHYTGQMELNTYTQEGLAALAAGRKEEATAKLRRAAELAQASGREDTVRMIRKVMTGIRRDMSGLDAEMASVKSRKTVQWRKKDDSVS